MQNIQAQLADRGFKTSVLAGDSYVDPRTVRNILISYKMALRGITFLFIHHMILALPKNSSTTSFTRLGQKT